jgi:hypothetical protein
MVPDYLSAFLDFGYLLVTIAYNTAMEFIEHTGRGVHVFTDCLFMFEYFNSVEEIDISNSESPLAKDYKAKYTPQQHTDIRRSDNRRPLSINQCKYDIINVLNVLSPFIKNRQTTFKRVFFNLIHDSTNPNLGETVRPHNTETVTIYMNMHFLKQRDLFISVLIHEISHMLLHVIPVNGGHTNLFIHMNTCLVHILKDYQNTPKDQQIKSKDYFSGIH